MRIADNIFFYEGDYITRTSLLYRGIGSSNFLVIAGEEQTFIDSGMSDGPHKKRIVKEMRHDGIRASDTKHVLLSHVHPDHVMFAKDLSRKKKLNLFFHADNEPFSRRDLFQFEAHYNFPSFILDEIVKYPLWFVRAAVKKYFGFDYLRTSRMIADGERLSLGCEVEVVHLPSHFPGHVGFYIPGDRIFYSADLFDFRVSDGGIINSALSSYEQVARDIKKIQQYDIEILVPGHGGMIQGRGNIMGTLNKIEKATEEYIIRLVRALKKSGSRGMTITDLTSQLFNKSVAYNESSRKIIIYNTLLHMRNKGDADYMIYNGRAWWYLR